MAVFPCSFQACDYDILLFAGELIYECFWSKNLSVKKDCNMLSFICKMHPLLGLVYAFHWMLCCFRQLTKNSNFSIASQILGISIIVDIGPLVLEKHLYEQSLNSKLVALLHVTGARNDYTILGIKSIICCRCKSQDTIALLCSVASLFQQ